ncbi:aspartate/glutamate racemase family protein [Aquamicrobium sp. NLF2-7]|uniref:aspartate/glutamate racemase family protein n=1 Tax=Aquamicrobium sp. NLF2-7 TaxID=2918753 RepID=UPI001EFAE8DA|nr:aspartate/glutamate racemase family protein [Aquamicrobium sp. NLF2-7]MCG8274453.1 aspartate/glutamate racemase family protein [Aquamicrobium sp. NLF2-7]
MNDIHIRILSPVVSTNRSFEAEQAVLATSGVQLSKVHVAHGTRSIESLHDSALSVPELLRLAVEAEQEGVDALVIDCMADPGLMALRERVAIPVLGPSQTAMHLAALLGHRFSVVTLARHLRVLFGTAAASYGTAASMASCRWIDMAAGELAGSQDRVRAAVLAQAVKAVEEDKADTIILGCTGLLGLAEEVASGLNDRGYDALVIDPLPATIRQAHAIVAAGLSHSRDAYPLPARLR